MGLDVCPVPFSSLAIQYKEKMSATANSERPTSLTITAGRLSGERDNNTLLGGLHHRHDATGTGGNRTLAKPIQGAKIGGAAYGPENRRTILRQETIDSAIWGMAIACLS